MEAASRLPMVSLEPKETQNAPNFGSVFRHYLMLHYGESSSAYDKEITELDNRRNSAVKASKDNIGLESLKRYFFELKMLYPRFPMNEGEPAAVEFCWRDNFTGKDIKSKDPKFEEANILYNIGAMHSILGTVDPRKDSDSMKVSCQHFQCAAGAFERIRVDYPQMPSFDQSYDVLTFYITLMLAQAHECILEKSLLDNRKSIIIAKVSAQVVDFYKELLRALDNEATMRMPGMEGFKEFIPRQLLELKVAYYQAMVYYHMACQSEEAQKWGERIGYLEAAVKELDHCKKIVKVGIWSWEKIVWQQASFAPDHNLGEDECTVAEAFVRDIVQQKLNSAKKDNDFIYHEKVLDVKTLPAVKGTPIGKAIRFNEYEFLQPSKDRPEVKVIFERLLPMLVYERLSLYSAKKDNLLRDVTGKVQWKDGLLMSVVSALRLEQLKAPLDFNVIPQTLLNNMAVVRSEGDVQQRIDRESESLNDMMEELRRLSSETQSIVDLLKNAKLEKNLSQELDKIRTELSQYSAALTVAVTSSEDLFRLITGAKDGLVALSGSVESVRMKLPSLDHLTKNENVSADLTELNKLLAAVDKMKTQRQSLLADIKSHLEMDDITKRILVPKDGGELDTFLTAELEKHAEKMGYLNQNLDAQDEIIARLTMVVDRLADFRAGLISLKAEREDMLRMYEDVFHSYENFTKKITEGLDFYRSLKENLTKVKQRAEDVLKKTPMGSAKPKLTQPPVATEESSRRPNAASQGPRLADYMGQVRYSDGVGQSFQPGSPSPTVPSQKSSGRPTLKDYLDAKKSLNPTTFGPNGISNQPFIQSDRQNDHVNRPAPPVGYQNYIPPSTYTDPQYYGQSEYVATRPYQPVVSVPALRPPTVRQPPPPPANTPALFSGSLGGSLPAQSSGHYQNQNQNTQNSFFETTQIVPNQQGFPQTGFGFNTSTQYVPQQPQSNGLPHFYQTNGNAGQMANYQAVSNTLPSAQWTTPIPQGQTFQQGNGQWTPESYAAGPHFGHQQSNWNPSNGQSAASWNPDPLPSNFTNSSASGNQQPSWPQQNYNEAAVLNSQSAAVQTAGFTAFQRTVAPAGYLSDENKTGATGSPQFYGSSPMVPRQQKEDLSLRSFASQAEVLPMATALQLSDTLPAAPPTSMTFQPAVESQVSSAVDIFSEANSKTAVMRSRRASTSSGRSTDEMLSTSPGKQEDEFILQPQVLTIEEIKRLKIQQNQGPIRDFFENGDRLMEFQKNFDQFETASVRLINSAEELKAFWKELQDQQTRDAAKHLVAVARCFPKKNRDPRIMPYDSSRVILQNAKDDYINASFIEGLSTYCPRMIATQTPLANTCSDFWTMVIEQGVEVIAAIMTDYEVKEFCYWPVNRQSPLSFGPITVSLQKESTEEEHWTIRLLHVNHNLTRLTKSVVHLRFRGWPARDVPEKPFAFASFVKEVAAYQRKQRVLSKPSLIHCHFGTGPTGIFCAALSFASSVESGLAQVNLQDVIRKMRNSRKFMLDSIGDLKFLHEVSLTYGRRILHQHGALPSYSESIPSSSIPVVKSPPLPTCLVVPDVLSDIRHELQRRRTPSPPPGILTKFIASDPAPVERSSPVSAGKLVEGTTFLSDLSGSLASLTAGAFNLNPVAGSQEKRTKITKDSFSAPSTAAAKSVATPDDPLSGLDPFWKMKKG